MSEDTLQYPTEIAAEIGLSRNRIGALRRQGCPFFGRKTSVKIVRAFLLKTMGAESLLAQDARPRRSSVNKSGARVAKND